MSLALEAARKLQDKLLSSKVPLAVFVLYGSWVSSKVNTDHFLKKVRQTPERLMGVYTIDARLEDIAADFIEAGIK